MSMHDVAAFLFCFEHTFGFDGVDGVRFSGLRVRERGSRLDSADKAPLAGEYVVLVESSFVVVEVFADASGVAELKSPCLRGLRVRGFVS